MGEVHADEVLVEAEVTNVDWRPLETADVAPVGTLCHRERRADLSMSAATDKLRWPCRMHGSRACVYYKLRAQGGAAATGNGMSEAARGMFGVMCAEACPFAGGSMELASLPRPYCSVEPEGHAISDSAGVLTHCSNLGKPGLLVLTPTPTLWCRTMRRVGIHPGILQMDTKDRLQSSFLKTLWDEPSMLHELLAAREHPLV
jgi:hypothetical protein